MKIPPLLFTREQRAWAILYVPMLTGACVSSSSLFSVLIFISSATSFFLAYAPLQIVLRHTMGSARDAQKFYAGVIWGSVFFVLGSVLLIPLLMEGKWQLIWIGSCAGSLFFLNFLISKRFQKTLVGDLIGMLALTLGAPAAYYVSSGHFDQTAFLLWFLNFLFFSSGAFYVHMNIRATSSKKKSFTFREKTQYGFHNLTYQAVILFLLSVLIVSDRIPPLVLGAFLPMFMYSLIGTFNLSTYVRFKRIGLLLLGHSIFFAIYLIALVF